MLMPTLRPLAGLLCRICIPFALVVVSLARPLPRYCALSLRRFGTISSDLSRAPTIGVMSTAQDLQDRVRSFRSKDKKRLAVLQGFFKTGKGQYGEGDQFLGVYNPDLRSIVRSTEDCVPLSELEHLLQSSYNEERALALLFLCDYYKRAKGDGARREEIFQFYLSQIARVNNWNLVDLSCYHIVGDHLMDKPRDLLLQFAKSDSLWERRIAVVSTFAFIKTGDFSTTLALASQLLEDKEDLMHKAVGWMLREVGKRNTETLHGFLRANAYKMPRVCLRYAVERLSDAQRKKYLKATEALD